MAKLLTLSSAIDDIPTINDVKVKLLNKTYGIFNVYDLINHYPYRYVDKSKLYKTSDLRDDTQYIQLYGKITQVKTVGVGPKKRLVALFDDGEGVIELIWFQGVQWVEKFLDTKSNYIVFGKPQLFRTTYSIVHPEIKKAQPNDIEHLAGIKAIYPSSEAMKKKGLDSTGISKLIDLVFQNMASDEIFEFLPKDIIDSYSLKTYPKSIYQIHFPKQISEIAPAQYRLKFNEFFLIQLQLKFIQKKRYTAQAGYHFESIQDHFLVFYNQYLPFSLTNAQKKVLKEIRSDTLSGIQMNRLLQGDVGSGKTIVALMTMLMAIDNGYQACIMAPTEILATQHYESIEPLVRELNIVVKLLTGNTKSSDKKLILDELEHGKIDILIGTHALIEPTVIFRNLGMVVIDEQHRFGVEQRSKLWAKNEKPPHVLVMTATPIPRTLAMTLYGDLDYSVIDELPPGRKEIKTIHKFYRDIEQIYSFIKEEIKKGRQIYIVYPLIEESKTLDLENLIEGFERLQEVFPPNQYSMTMVHGKMKPDEKASNMQLFIEGKVNILVSTTVIEVGVNVPNASIMLIQNADRFGLSQLHQLRGRVGRGAEQSFCILMTEYQLSMDARKRMSIMTETSNGFIIAEEDLKMRGPGDVAGTKQSGDIQLKIASISQDTDILNLASRVAQEILDEDPLLHSDKYKYLNFYLKRTKKELDIWSKIT